MYREFLKRRDSFIITAIEILGELGVQGLTTRELAKRQGVTEPAIYRQFNSKNDIIIAIVNEFAKYDEFIVNTIYEHEMGAKEGILYFALLLSEYYQSYPEITSVMFCTDFYRDVPEANEKMKSILEKRREVIGEMIEKGKVDGQISSNISAIEFAEVILGVIMSSTYFWKFNGKTENLKEKVKNVLDFIIEK